MHDHIRGSHRLRWWFALAMTAIVLSTVMVAIVVIAAGNARNSTDVADDAVRRMGERTAELMLGHIDDAIESADALSILLTPDQLASPDADLERLLAAQVQTVSQISGAFVGFPDGSFRFVSRDDDGELSLRRIDTAPTRKVSDTSIDADLRLGLTWQVEAEYDPRERPWYDRAVDSEESVWTDPYVFFESQQPGVTLSQAVRDDRGELLAVIGIDVRLDQLSSFLDDLPIGNGAEAFIVAGDAVVAAPSDYDLIQSGDDRSLEPGTIFQLGVTDDEFRDLALGMSPIETDDGGRLHQIELVGPDAPRWSVLVRTERPELSAAVDRAARISIVAVALTGLLLLLLIPLVTRALRRALADLDRRANIDTLTDVLNRGAVLDAAASALDESLRTGQELTVAVIDVDDFKRINDELGHRIGDEALSEIAEILVGSVRQRDLVGRIGGDEFIIVFQHLDRANVDRALRRVQDHLARRGTVDRAIAHVPTLTIGVASRNERTLTVADLVAEADDALLVAKHEQKGSIAWSEPRTTPSRPPTPV